MTVDPERKEILEVSMMNGKGPLYRYLVVIIEMNKLRKREFPDKNEFDKRFVNDIREIRKISYNKKRVREKRF